MESTTKGSLKKNIGCVFIETCSVKKVDFLWKDLLVKIFTGIDGVAYVDKRISSLLTEN